MNLTALTGSTPKEGAQSDLPLELLVQEPLSLPGAALPTLIKLGVCTPEDTVLCDAECGGRSGGALQCKCFRAAEARCDERRRRISLGGPWRVDGSRIGVSGALSRIRPVTIMSGLSLMRRFTCSGTPGEDMYPQSLQYHSSSGGNKTDGVCV